MHKSDHAVHQHAQIGVRRVVESHASTRSVIEQFTSDFEESFTYGVNSVLAPEVKSKDPD